MSNLNKMSKSLESIVNYIRNVLRKEGITGMDSINHCIAFIVCRMLDKDVCKQFDIDEKYSYEKMMKTKDGKEIGNQDLYSKFYSGNAESFIGQLVTKLGFKNIKFKLEGNENLKDIMKKLKDFDPKHIEAKYDIIGTIYEIHLKSGTSNSMRDLGQYYTHRLVIDYMIKLCVPVMENGKVEKIVDPTMGTGGFLTMAIKYLNTKYKNKIDWSKNKNKIIGFDIDDNVRNMALLNVFMETGELFDETICKQDTLHNDMKFEDGEIMKKAKIILANEPMGLKNIIFASCCERIKNGLKAGTKAEPLFLKLFMEALDDGGRCAVIVPDGVLFGDSTLHNCVRKMMVENFNLKKVISLNDDFFLNTGVKTSILFFAKDGTKTKEVEFSELKLKDDKVEENNIIKCKYEDIKKNNYSLFVNKYNTKEIEKIEGIEYKKLGDICDFEKKSKRQASYGKDEGKYNFYTSGEKIKKCDDADYNEETIILGDGGKANIYIDDNFSCSDHNHLLKNKYDKLYLKYLYYYLFANIELIEKGFKGSTIKNLSKEYVQNLEIPIPPLQIQKKIIEALDVINSNNETCKKYIDETTYILKHYIAMNYGDNSKKLGDICDMKSGKFNSKDKKETGEFPFYTSEVNSPVGFSDEFCFDYEEYLILIKDGGAGQGKYGDQIGLGKVFKVKGKSCATSHQYAICIKNDLKEILNDYLYLYLMTKKNQIMDLALYTTGLGCIRKSELDEIIIKYPSLKKQKEIITFCDELISKIEYTRKQIIFNENLMKKTIEMYLKNTDEKEIFDKEDTNTDFSDMEEKKAEETKKKKYEKNIEKEESYSDSNSSISVTDNDKEKKPSKKSKK